MAKPDRRDVILKRIYSRVAIQDTGYRVHGVVSPCHCWTGNHSGSGRGGGYGRISIDGWDSAVHRVVYTHYFGYIPPKMQIDHKCNVRNCVNPEHLEMVTHKENQKRRAVRQKENSLNNRSPKGKRNVTTC